MTIREPINDTMNTLWCGPAAISCLTGAPVSKINRLILKYRKEHGYEIKHRKEVVRGIYNQELLGVLKKLEKKPNARRFPKQLARQMKARSLQAFFHDVGHMGPFIVQVTTHYVVINQGMICDNHTKIPVPFSEHPKFHRAIVRNFWYFGK